MPIKVLHVNVDDQGYGGVYSLVRSIIASDPEGIEFDIACFEPFESQRNVDDLASHGCTVYYAGRAGNKMVKQFAYFENLKNLLEEQRYDIVHIHSDVANKMLIAAKAAQVAAVQNIVLHSHASGTEGRFKALRSFAHGVSAALLPLGSVRAVACSAEAASWMFPAISSRDIGIIHNGVDLERFRFDSVKRERMREELGITSSLVVGHVGRFVHQKNHRYLMKVFAAVVERHPDSVLLLIGEGLLEESIRRQAQQLNVHDKVIFYGLSDDIAGLYMAMDVFLLPSSFEGLPLVGVEAQAASLPAVFSETITDEVLMSDRAKHLPIDDVSVDLWAQSAVEMGLSDRTDRLDMIKTDSFALDATIHSFVKLYESLMRS